MLLRSGKHLNPMKKNPYESHKQFLVPLPLGYPQVEITLECGDLTPLSFLLFRPNQEKKKESGVKSPRSKSLPLSFLLFRPNQEKKKESGVKSPHSKSLPLSFLLFRPNQEKKKESGVKSPHSKSLGGGNRTHIYYLHRVCMLVLLGTGCFHFQPNTASGRTVMLPVSCRSMT